MGYYHSQHSITHNNSLPCPLQVLQRVTLLSSTSLPLGVMWSSVAISKDTLLPSLLSVPAPSTRLPAATSRE
ncbi:hypothetical protein GBAR_LOCUS8802 [Geodia barretti]|uniref:Uncharacterized protein n=1 Tax=Geodia barretti TaxID=519541 RepID=A0AA35RLZ5_GEOBA|nr:hypothetical protein GBAR_LOCUS8802 [Geodia barretti]